MDGKIGGLDTQQVVTTVAQHVLYGEHATLYIDKTMGERTSFTIYMYIVHDTTCTYTFVYITAHIVGINVYTCKYIYDTTCTWVAKTSQCEFQATLDALGS